MAVVCPHCNHSLKLKDARAGKFKPKCSRCGRAFLLTVSGGAELKFTTSFLPGEGDPSRPPTAFNPEETAPSVADASAPERSAALEATVAPAAGRVEDADFSVAASAVKVESVPDDATMALAQTSPPPEQVNLEATEAEPSAAPPPRAKKKKGDDEDAIPDVLGGYQIVKELGRGGMGAVYLARQVSLDRPVALKVMNSRWASNPSFLVRFTREAYAAAQLVHHNVVQVYDIGSDKGVNYFSMELVEGSSLGDLVKQEGRLAPEVAAGYILQAARGLKFAHDRGMIHRDIKPDNLMINTQGVVKVADLGLVRTPGLDEKADVAPMDTPAANAPRSLSSMTGVTLAGQAMGTPSYMSPEQARDATAVDHRADIYSLGCTLFVMVTGRPVYGGTTAMEVMTKHASEPIPRAEAVVKDVPRALGDIVTKMLAKKPDDRYQSMDEVVKAMEDYLGIHGSKAAATEQHLRTLEEGVKELNASPLLAIRSLALTGFFAGCAALAALFLFILWWRVASFFFALGAFTALSYFVVHGTGQRTYLFRRARDLLFTTSWLDLIKLAVGVLLLALVLFLLGLLWVWLLAAFLGVGLALGVYYGLDKRIAAQRAQPLEKVERMLKTLRLRGLSEEALQEFVSQYAGERWEELFEALFGYEAKIAARAKLVGRSLPKFAAWRDPLVRWIDATQKARQEAREREHLQKVEQKGLEAQGVSAGEARARAEQMAEAMVQKAAELKEAAPAALTEPTVAPQQGTRIDVEDRPKKAPPQRVMVQDLFQVADAPRPASRPAMRMGPLLAAPFGGGPRFLIGSVLLVISLGWMYANNLLPSSTNFDAKETYTAIWTRMKETKPLAVPGVPEVVLKALCGVGALAAGFVLVVSSLWYSWRMGVLQYLAAAVFLAGPVSGYLPEVGPLSSLEVSLMAGAAISLVGFLFGRDT